MFSFHKLLYPVDFSDHCYAAAPYVADLANRFRAKLHFLHVMEDAQNFENFCPQRAAELRTFAGRVWGGMYRTEALAYGKPAPAIIRYAETNGIDIIAMPTRGHGTLRRWVLGSVTQNVLRQASSAVWTESATGQSHARWSPIVCAVDLERDSEQVVSYASALAEIFFANLIVVHAIPPISQGSLWHPSDLPPALSCSEARRKLEELLHGLNISCELVMETGSVENVIGRVAENRRAELLVIGRGGNRQVGSSLGTHTYDLVRRAPCPVVSCPGRPFSNSCFWTEWQQEDSATQELYSCAE